MDGKIRTLWFQKGKKTHANQQFALCSIFFFFWCGNTPHAHMLMGENPYGQLINYAGMEEARTSWRCDLQQDPALFCCIF